MKNTTKKALKAMLILTMLVTLLRGRLQRAHRPPKRVPPTPSFWSW